MSRLRLILLRITDSDRRCCPSQILINNTNIMNKEKIFKEVQEGNIAKPLLPVVYFLGVKVVKYRIVRDCYAGFECQKWRLFFPFWKQMRFCNTHRHLEDAIKYCWDNGDSVVLSS